MEAIDILNLVLGFLGTSAGISVLVYLYNQSGGYVDETENKIDDKIYDIFPEAVDFIVQNFELGEAEEILKRLLKQLNKTNKDTRIIEKKVEKELDKVTKK